MTSVEMQRLRRWLSVLEDTDAETSKIAADKLAEMGHPDAVQPLIRAMKTRTAMVSLAATQALGKLGDLSAVPDLIEIMNTHTDVYIQTAAAEALGKLRAKAAVPALKAVITDYLKGSTDHFSRVHNYRRGLFTSAVHSLKLIGTPDAVRFAEQAERSG